jgi:hypothetical protein
VALLFFCIVMYNCSKEEEDEDEEGDMPMI